MNKKKRFDFGKYEGHLISKIAKINPSYIKWCNKNVNGFYYEIEEESWRNSPHLEIDTYRDLHYH